MTASTDFGDEILAGAVRGAFASSAVVLLGSVFSWIRPVRVGDFEYFEYSVLRNTCGGRIQTSGRRATKCGLRHIGWAPLGWQSDLRPGLCGVAGLR